MMRHAVALGLVVAACGGVGTPVPDGGTDAGIKDVGPEIDVCAGKYDPDAGTCVCGAGCAPYTAAWCNSGCNHM